MCYIAEIELHAMVYEGLGKFSEAEKLLGTENARTLLTTPPTFLMARRLSLLFSAKDYQTVMDKTIEGLHSEYVACFGSRCRGFAANIILFQSR